ncbi:hypothetical protein Bbelb_061970 [Branchiostoma belcheri]|nr:hypothetical protein Bbelb_061970 [Branchiostoma belcheri]
MTPSYSSSALVVPGTVPDNTSTAAWIHYNRQGVNKDLYLAAYLDSGLQIAANCPKIDENGAGSVGGRLRLRSKVSADAVIDHVTACGMKFLQPRGRLFTTTAHRAVSRRGRFRNPG